MGILDNLEAYLDLDQIDNSWNCSDAWEDSDLELAIQNPHISTN